MLLIPRIPCLDGTMAAPCQPLDDDDGCFLSCYGGCGGVAQVGMLGLLEAWVERGAAPPYVFLMACSTNFISLVASPEARW